MLLWTAAGVQVLASPGGLAQGLGLSTVAHRHHNSSALLDKVMPPQIAAALCEVILG